jgi:hypothetical protein
MKLFAFFAAAALIAGGIYHKQVSQYFAGLNAGTSQSGGAASVVGSFVGMSNSNTAVMSGVDNKVNNALDR